MSPHDPPQSFVDNFIRLLTDADVTEFQRVLEMKVTCRWKHTLMCTPLNHSIVSPSLLLTCSVFMSCTTDRLGGLVVRASTSRTENPGFEFRLRRDFSGSSHTGELKIGTPVATLPGAWRYRVIAGTGRPGVSVL